MFLSSNASSAKIGPDGVVTAGERGEAFVMARFSTFTIALRSSAAQGLQFTFPPVPEFNYIDKFVDAKLKKLRIEPSELCTDEEFFRRAYRRYRRPICRRSRNTASSCPAASNKREQLVDELLGRKEFAELWVLKWAELLQIRSGNQVSYKAMLLYYSWLQDKVARNVPDNEWVAELLGPTAAPSKTRHQLLPKGNRHPQVSENVAQVFMGMRCSAPSATTIRSTAGR